MQLFTEGEVKLKSEPIISKYLFMKAGKNKIPLSGTFELLPMCNMDCKMCYIRKDKKEVDEKGGLKSADEWISLAKEAQKEGMLFLLLTGGEPFLYKDFKYLYKELKKLGLMIAINTNGTLLSEEIVNWLADDPPYRINMTIYGGSNKTYERLCNNPKGFDQITRAAELLKKAGISVKLNASITPENIEDIEEMFDFAKRFDFYIDTTTYMFPPIRKDENLIGCGERFTSKESGIYAVEIDKLRFPKDELKLRIDNIRKRAVNEGASLDSCKITYENKVVCRAGSSTFWITWDGKMSPCGMMNYPFINVFEYGFLKSWRYIVDETSKIRTASECSNCKNRLVCPTCAAIAVSETGNFDKIPKYACEYTEAMLESYDEIYEVL